MSAHGGVLRAAAPSKVTYLAFYALSMAGTGIILPLTSLYLTSAQALSGTQAGACFLGLGAAGLVAGPVAGRASDLHSPVLVAAAGLFIQGFGFVWISVFGGFLPTLCGLLIIGVGNGIRFSTATPMLVWFFGPEALPNLVGSQFTIMTGGMALGTLVGTSVINALGNSGYALLFRLNAASFLLFAIFTATCYRGRERTTPRPERVPYRMLLDPWRDRNFRYLLIYNLIATLAVVSQFTNVVPTVLHSMHVSITQIGMVYSSYAIGSLFLQPLAAKLIKHLGPRACLSWALAAWATARLPLLLAGFMPMPFPVQLASLATFAALSALGTSISGRALQPVAAARAPSEKLGSYSAGIAFVGGVGTMIGPAIGLFTLDGFGPAGYWSIAISGIAVGPWFTHRRRREAHRCTGR
jgi:MFS family permease